MSSIVHASLKRSLLSCLIATALTLPVLAASGKDEGHNGRHFDARTTLTLPASRAPLLEQASALQELLGFLYAECCTRNKAVEPQAIVCCR